MNRIAQVIEPVEIVARPFLAQQHVNNTSGVEIRVARERRRTAFAQICEDEPEILFGRIAANLDLRLEGLVFARLFDTLARSIIFPPVIKTSNTVILDPTRRELRSAMRAPKRRDMRRAGLPSIKREIFAHDPQRNRFAGGQILGAVNRLPKRAQIAPSQSARLGAVKVYRTFTIHDCLPLASIISLGCIRKFSRKAVASNLPRQKRHSVDFDQTARR